MTIDRSTDLPKAWGIAASAVPISAAPRRGADSAIRDGAALALLVFRSKRIVIGSHYESNRASRCLGGAKIGNPHQSGCLSDGAYAGRFDSLRPLVSFCRA